MEGTQTKKIGKLKFEIRAGGHVVLADAPVKSGGTDEAMGPHALLESSLAACTAITLQMYADHKKWPLIDSDVWVKIVAEGEQSRIERVIELHGDLSTEQRARLTEIAEKCPIHKLLMSQITITTSLKS